MQSSTHRKVPAEISIEMKGPEKAVEEPDKSLKNMNVCERSNNAKTLQSFICILGAPSCREAGLPCSAARGQARCHSDSAGQTGIPGPASGTAAAPAALQTHSQHFNTHAGRSFSCLLVGELFSSTEALRPVCCCCATMSTLPPSKHF